ncbi:hypothetical protein J7K19_07675 [bacterium]|nr:hypothetical protein [bacterium]
MKRIIFVTILFAIPIFILTLLPYITTEDERTGRLYSYFKDGYKVTVYGPGGLLLAFIISLALFWGSIIVWFDQSKLDRKEKRVFLVVVGILWGFIGFICHQELLPMIPKSVVLYSGINAIIGVIAGFIGDV